MLVLVKKWTEKLENNQFRFKSIEIEKSEDTREQNEAWMRSIVSDIVENASYLGDIHNSEINHLIKDLASLTKELYEKWNNLKVNILAILI